MQFYCQFLQFRAFLEKSEYLVEMATMGLMGEKENKVKVMAFSKLKNLCGVLQVYPVQSIFFLFLIGRFIESHFYQGSSRRARLSWRSR
jgi:hypothetical protein